VGGARGRPGARYRFNQAVIPAQAGGLFYNQMAGRLALDRHSCESRNPVTSRFDCRHEARVPPARRAFRTAAAARVTFLLLAQKKSNPKKMAYNARSIVLG
jgi:hypothetical protein